MGFYFKHRGHQSSFENRHKSAIRYFSYITIAYQLFFITWLGSIVGQPWLIAAVLAIGLAIYLNKTLINYWAVAIYVVSIALFIGFLEGDLPPIDINTRTNWPHAVLPLAIGFILSPYLDITFHRAFKESTYPKLSFAVGFGVLFLSLLGFVYYYESSLSKVFFNQSVPAAIIYPVVAFLVLQTAFTMAAHCSELSIQSHAKPHILAASILIFSLCMFGANGLLKNTSIPGLGIPVQETLYKSFLFFYSLVFPLYLLIGKSKVTYLWVLALCAPAYALGFLIGDDYSFGLTLGVVVFFGGWFWYTMLSKKADKMRTPA